MIAKIDSIFVDAGSKLILFPFVYKRRKLKKEAVFEKSTELESSAWSIIINYIMIDYSEQEIVHIIEQIDLLK